MIRGAAQRHGDRTALSCEGRRMSFREFDDATDRLGNALLAGGLVPGDRVAVLLPNGIEVLVAYYALAKAGLVRVALNGRETLAEHDYKLAYSGARALIASDAWSGLACEWVIGPERLAALIHDMPSRPCVHERPLDAPLRLGFTGGTTGKPKAVTLSTRGEMAEIAAFLIDLMPDIAPGEVMLHAAPIAHASGAFFLPNLLRGARAEILPHFDPQQFLERAEATRANATFLVPTMLAMVLDTPGMEHAKIDLKRLYYGASPIAPALLERGMQRFGRVFAQTYGQAESPMVITVLGPEEHDRIGSAGRPYTFVELRIVDDEDHDLPAGESGEIVCRGPQLMTGYWERPEETAKVMRGGWLHTGDVGRLDDDGYLYIVDRKNDMIISGGYNVYPREVEDVLQALAGIRDAAVVGLADARWGERVVAVVSGRSVPDFEIVKTHCQQRLAGYKCPRELHVWEELPKSGAGKILRRTVRDRLSA